MKESYWGYWIIILGIFIFMVMMLANDATTSNTQDYYQLKEVANSALYDALDYSYYTQTRQIRILKEVFVENFIRRFAETVSVTDSYKIDFFDLYESPPKVSIRIASTTAGFIIGRDVDDASTADVNEGVTSLDVVNSIDLIIEFNSKTNGDEDLIRSPYAECDYYSED